MGGRVVASGGTFVLTANLDLVSGVALSGQGWSTIFQKVAGLALLIHDNDVACTDVLIEDICFDGASDATITVVIQLDTSGSARNCLRRLYVKDFTSNSSFRLDNTADLVVEDCLLVDAGEIRAGTCVRPKISRCTVRNSDQTGIIVGSSTEPVVEGCHIDNSAQNGIDLGNVTYGLVKGCLVENVVTSGGAIEIGEVNAGWNTVEGCVIHDCRQGIYAGNTNSGYGRHTIRGNTIKTTTAGPGINLIACPHSVIEGNVLEAMHTHGIDLDDYSGVDCDYTTIIGNTIKGWGDKNDAGLYAAILVREAAGCTVVGNSIDGTGGAKSDHGIREVGTADYTVIHGNRIANCATAAMVPLGANSLIRNNLGWATENSGTATLANGTTSIAVTHGLAVTPAAGDIMVTPIEAWGAMTEFYIDTYTSTQFTIHADQNPGQDVDFAWRAVVL